jgi:hypothetical protein
MVVFANCPTAMSNLRVMAVAVPFWMVAVKVTATAGLGMVTEPVVALTTAEFDDDHVILLPPLVPVVGNVKVVAVEM